MSSQTFTKLEQNCLVKVTNLTQEVLEYCKKEKLDVETFVPHSRSSFYKGYRNLRNMILSKENEMYPSVLIHIRECKLHYWYMSHKDIMIDMWRRRCLFAIHLCKERSIDPKDYYPKNRSSEKKEEKLYQMLLQYRCAHNGDKLINDYNVYPEIDNMIKYEYGFTKWLSNFHSYNQKEYYYTLRRIRLIAKDEEIDLNEYNIRDIAYDLNINGYSEILPNVDIDFDTKPQKRRSGKVFKIKCLKERAKEQGLKGYSRINLKNHKEWAQKLGIKV